MSKIYQDRFSCSPLLLTLLATMLIMTSCVSPSPDPTKIVIAPTSPPVATNIRVITTQPSETRIKTEPFPLPNCNGTSELHQKLGSHASATRKVEVGIKAVIKGGGGFTISEVIKLQLELAVEGEYKRTYENINARLDTIEMSAMPRTHVVYEIGWYEQTFNSYIDYMLDGQVYENPYEYKLEIPKIDNSYQVNCANSNPSNSNIVNPTAVPPTAFSPTSVPAVTSAPAIVPKFPDIIISATLQKGVVFTAPIDGNYTFTIKSGFYCTSKTLCRSIIHGYFGREIVWKNWYGNPHPIEEDFELGCWENETAKDRNCGVGKAMTIFMKAQQYVRWVVMEDQKSFNDNTGGINLSVELSPQ